MLGLALATLAFAPFPASGPEKSTYSTGSSSPPSPKKRCKEGWHKGMGMSKAQCRAACAAISRCTHAIHFSDDGCQISTTGCTLVDHGYGADTDEVCPSCHPVPTPPRSHAKLLYLSSQSRPSSRLPPSQHSPSASSVSQLPVAAPHQIFKPTSSPSPSSPRCNGRDSGCSNIAEGDGDCDRDSDCQPGLRCGKDNCVGAQFDATDDCCFAPPSRPDPKERCKEGQHKGMGMSKAQCRAACAAASGCTHAIHFSDDGCQLSTTGCTRVIHTYSADTDDIFAAPACGATIPSGKRFASGKTATSPCGSDGCDACFEDIPKCGPPGVGKQFASGKSATTPCGTNCGACFEDILTCGALPSGKQFASGKTATFPCGTTCATTCFEDKFPKPFNSPWFCTDRPDDPKDPSKCSTFFYDKDSEYVTSMSEYGDMNFLRNPLQYDYDKKAGGSVAKAIKHDARDRKAPKGIEKYEHNTMCGLDSCGVGVYVVTPQEIEVGKSFSANVFADMRHVPGNIQVGHFKVTYPTALYEVLGWEYGAFPKDSLLGTVIPCGETLSCREIDDGTSAAQIIEHPDVG